MTDQTMLNGAEEHQNKKPFKPKVKKPPRPADDELATMFIEKHRDEYVYMYGAWHRWDAGLWKQDNRHHKLAMLEVLKRNKKLGIYPSMNKVTSVLDLSTLYLYADEEQMDAHKHYINLENGMFNLSTGKLEDHNRELYFTSQLPFAYDAKAKCPTWTKFLRQTLRTSDGAIFDAPLIRVLQEAFGYSLTAETGYRVSFWLVGASGTGKSTLLNVLTALAGDSYTTIDLDFLGMNEYQLADVVGKRVVTFTEPSVGQVLNDGAYKRLVSQDVIRARLAYGDPFNFVPVCKVWGAMNSTPRVTDRSDAVFNRVIIIPMDTVIPDEHRDPYLIDKLLEELPGIFNWSLQGLKRLKQERGFSRSSAVTNARKEFRAENDTEAAFLEDWFDRDPAGQIRARELYTAYKDWCAHNGYRPKSERSVSKDWQRLGLQRHRNNGIWYIGAIWKPENER